MSQQPITDLSKLCIHTITTKPWAIEEAAKNFAAAGVKGITVWRDTLAGRDIKKTGDLLRGHDLSIVSLCRGGFFPSIDKTKRQAAIDDNRKAIEEAHQLGTNLIVLVCGADPGQSLEDSRQQIQDGIEAVLPEAAAAGVRLAIEPLHPMYADTRSAINTLAQANDMTEAIKSPWVGVAVDVYHLWWDPNLEQEIKRCGNNEALFAFHICDWKSPTVDMLNDRGLMGEGCIPLKKIRSWVEATGFDGFREVEIFSTEYWKQDQSQFLQKIITGYKLNA
ncbi:MAG TPA: sugar phosphate isomerase/epimerase family protein [Haliscomenobacter sp.]|uniref:sugar phosphate isomerase/epimerase family protein n=1 Tax=Haliscomenobacter sp. TaxID=2717303 RepID=UPI002BCAD301|nr:sugar phosphate isomerase/epimerase family protein [Haliscomenobacter sp.]HOY19827.1 sugar phosphate isomerase/epimerase family protein [Haliscomenobacter sp.]HPH17494.1 sugar phosphate isomerase/epimerase family protein [Haliscomenobacter sp.]